MPLSDRILFCVRNFYFTNGFRIRYFTNPIRILCFTKGRIKFIENMAYMIDTVCPGSSDPPEKKYLIYLHQKMRFTPFINYYDTLA